MDESEKKLLIRAYKTEKDPDKMSRIHAVSIVKIHGPSTSKVAASFFCGPHAVSERVKAYDGDGLAGQD